MEATKKSQESDKDIVYSKTVKAGKRIYYIDVKKNRKDELFLAITESKKVVNDDNDVPTVNFEKHKIFLYQEDFDNFIESLGGAIGFIKSHQEASPRPEGNGHQEIKIDIDF